MTTQPVQATAKVKHISCNAIVLGVDNYMYTHP